MPHDLNDLYYFAKVVECGGFAAAGRETGIPKSRLSRRIAELEERLQVRLLHRTTRKLALTEVGERHLQHCRNLLLEAEMAEQVIAELSVEPRGRLRLSAPVAMASSNLADLLPRFLERHPQVQLEILLTNRRVDLLNEGWTWHCARANSATRTCAGLPAPGSGDHADPRRPVADRRAAPGTSGRPEDLPFLGAIHNDRKVHATLIGPDGSRYQLEREPRLGVDDFVLRKKAAVAGLGVTLLPEGYCDGELADGSLVRILPQWTLPKSTLQAAYLPRSSQIPAIRALIDFLVEALQRPRARPARPTAAPSSEPRRSADPLQQRGGQAPAEQAVEPERLVQRTMPQNTSWNESLRVLWRNTCCATSAPGQPPSSSNRCRRTSGYASRRVRRCACPASRGRMRAGWPADRPAAARGPVRPGTSASASGRQHAEDQQDQQLRQRALQRARRVGAGRAWARVTGAWAPRRTVGGSMVSASSRALSRAGGPGHPGWRETTPGRPGGDGGRRGTRRYAGRLLPRRSSAG